MEIKDFWSDPSTMTINTKREIKRLEAKTKVADIIEEYSTYEAPGLLFRRLLRWKMFKEMYSGNPRFKFSDAIFERALDECLAGPQDFRDILTEWIDGEVNYKAIWDDKRFSDFVEKDKALKNFFYILLEVNHVEDRD